MHPFSLSLRVKTQQSTAKLITEEIGRIRIAKEIEGVIVKADTLGFSGSNG